MVFSLPKAGRLFAERAAELGLSSRKASPFAKWRVPLHHPDFPLVLLYSEKAGCTSFTKWFLFQIGKLEEAERYHRWIHRYRTSVLIEQPGYKAEAVRLVGSGRKPVIKLVRNPYTRAVSSFLHVLKVARKKDPERWERKLIAAARKGPGKPESAVPAMSFRDFLRVLPASGTALGEINSHIARQHMPAEDGRVTRIIKVERFAEDIRGIEAEFGLATSPVESLSESHHHRTSLQDRVADGGCTADLEITSEQVRQGRVPAYDSLYDEETRALVRTCFAIDFEAYGYEP